MWHVKKSKFLTHCKLTSGAFLTYLRTDISYGFPQRSSLQILQYIFSSLFIYLYIDTNLKILLSKNSWEVFKCTIYNVQEYVRLNNQCYFFSSVCKHFEVVNFNIRSFDNIEVVSFHKHLWLYWNSKTTNRCGNSCVFDGTLLWVVKNVSDMNDSQFFFAVWRILRHKLWKYPQQRHPNIVPINYSHQILT